MGGKSTEEHLLFDKECGSERKKKENLRAIDRNLNVLSSTFLTVHADGLV